MILLLSTVHLSDPYVNMQPLLLLISPIILPMTWRKTRSAPSPLSIPLLHMKMNHSDFISVVRVTGYVKEKLRISKRAFVNWW